MSLFLYHEGSSFLHRLNALTKLLFVGLLMVVLTLILDPITPLVVALLLLPSTMVLGRLSPGLLLRPLRPFVLAAFGLFWTTGLFYAADSALHPRALFQVGPAVLTELGAAYGASITFRILAIFAASLLFTLTTEPSALLQALIQQWRVSYRFGYGVMAAYRFVPLFDSQLASIRAAHRVRGAGSSGGPVARYHRFIGYMVPLLAGGVRQAERVALAMDARGFSGGSSRTYYRESAFGWRDLVFSAGTGAVLVAVLLELHALGWLGRLLPPFVS